MKQNKETDGVKAMTEQEVQLARYTVQYAQILAATLRLIMPSLPRGVQIEFGLPLALKAEGWVKYVTKGISPDAMEDALDSNHEIIQTLKRIAMLSEEEQVRLFEAAKRETT